MKLKNLDTFCPENCKGFAQTFLCSLSLLQLKKSLDSQEGKPVTKLNVFVQGNPGTGKTFVIICILNMIREVLRDQMTAQTVTPTGCSASYTGGQTSNRFFCFPNCG